MRAILVALERERTMSIAIPTTVLIHLAAAVSALLLGIVMLARRKGTASHKALGRVWAALMLTVAVSSLWIPRFLHFTWIHSFTLLTLVALPRAIYRIRTGNVNGHARAMKGLFIGGLGIAGIFAFAPGRFLGDLLWRGPWSRARWAPGAAPHPWARREQRSKHHPPARRAQH